MKLLLWLVSLSAVIMAIIERFELNYVSMFYEMLFKLLAWAILVIAVSFMIANVAIAITHLFDISIFIGTTQIV